MEEKPKRRWLRYSVRTLLVAVTVFCVWLGWQWRIVRERNAMRQLVEERGGSVVTDEPGLFQLEHGIDEDSPKEGQEEPTINWVRRAMGDAVVFEVNVYGRLLEQERNRIQEAFREAEFYPP